MSEILPDKYCKIPKANVYKSSSNKYFSCILTQSSIDKNKNKFYIMQIIKSLDSSFYYLYTRYGRIGEVGNIKISDYLNSYNVTKEFLKKFMSKTGNRWTGKTIDYKLNKRKYVMMDIVSPVLEKIDENNNSNLNLDPRILDTLSIISSKSLIIDTIKNYNDNNKVPLGKISSFQIQKAHDILRQIKSLAEIEKINTSDEIKQEDSTIINKLERLSSQFWTLIPISCGKKIPPIIKNYQQIKECVKLLEFMENIKVSANFLINNRNIDMIYNNLDIKIKCVDKKSNEWKTLLNFVKNTHGCTHHYNLELLDAFNVEKVKDDNNDVKNYFNNFPDHKLLVHGSKLVNYISILSKGIRIPKSNQVSNGSVLGLGAYFSDSISKSFNYCESKETNDIGYVLLCEVALGINPHIVINPTFDIKPTSGYTSRIALGEYNPEYLEKNIMKSKSFHEVKFPCGVLKKTNIENGNFLYNEFVIYDKRQYRFRYLLKLKKT